MSALQFDDTHTHTHMCTSVRPVGLMYLEYSGGTDCSAGARRSRINFVCDKSVRDGEPIFVTESHENGCLYLFEWRTAYACNREAVVGVEGSCKVADDALENFYYDFTSLRDNGPYKINGGGMNFEVGICGAVTNADSSPPPGACMREGNGDTCHAIGKASGEPRFNQGITSLHYESDDDCATSSSGKKTSTHINFLCDRNGDKNASAVDVVQGGKLNFNSVSWDKCEYTFDFSTVHACRPRTSESCLFTDETSGKAGNTLPSLFRFRFCFLI